MSSSGDQDEVDESSPEIQLHANPAEKYWYHGEAALPYNAIAGLYASGAPAATRQSLAGYDANKSPLCTSRKEPGVFRLYDPVRPYTLEELEDFYGLSPIMDRVIKQGHDLTSTILRGSRVWFYFYSTVHNFEFPLTPNNREQAARKYASIIIDAGVHPGIFRQEVGDMLWMCDLDQDDKNNLNAVYTYLSRREDMKMDQAWKSLDEMVDGEGEKILEIATKLWDVGLELLIEDVQSYWNAKFEQGVRDMQRT